MRCGQMARALPEGSNTVMADFIKMWLKSSVVDAYGRFIQCHYTQFSNGDYAISKLNYPVEKKSTTHTATGMSCRDVSPK